MIYPAPAYNYLATRPLTIISCTAHPKSCTKISSHKNPPTPAAVERVWPPIKKPIRKEPARYTIIASTHFKRVMHCKLRVQFVHEGLRIASRASTLPMTTHPKIKSPMTTHPEIVLMHPELYIQSLASMIHTITHPKTGPTHQELQLIQKHACPTCGIPQIKERYLRHTQRNKPCKT